MIDLRGGGGRQEEAEGALVAGIGGSHDRKYRKF